MVGRRAGWLWTGIIALLFLFMTVATHQSWLPQMTNYDKSHEVYGLVVYVVTTASLIGVNLFYQGFANETIQNIKDRNHELELKRQELQAILDTRDQFIASVSHELRTPMNAIMGFNELLKEHQANNPKVQEILNLTHQSGEHLLTVINDVLDYSQFQSGKLGIHPEAFVLSQVADSASGLNDVNSGGTTSPCHSWAARRATASPVVDSAPRVGLISMFSRWPLVWQNRASASSVGRASPA
jgi:signal transduction histidine kinase